MSLIEEEFISQASAADWPIGFSMKSIIMPTKEDSLIIP